MRRRVLITGGCGYVGSALVKRLVRDGGYHVTVLDNGLIPGWRMEGGPVDYIEGDVRDIADWSAVLKNVDCVVHLAAVVGDPACSINTQLTWEVNYLATVRLATECRKAGVARFVFSSTCSNYGVVDEVADIYSPLQPQSDYAESKVRAEHHLLVSQDVGFTPVIVRLATLYGLAPRMRFDLAVNVMTANAVHNSKVEVHGGKQWRPFLHVNDAAKALQLAVEAGATPSVPQVYNCGSATDCYQLGDIGRLIAAEVPGAELVTLDSATDVRDYRVSFDRIEKRIGFRADLRVVDGIREMRDSLTAGEFADYAHERYSDHLSVSASVQRGDPAGRCRSGLGHPDVTPDCRAGSGV
ncbi:NAD-dependent epimerase/dehydratase family protein [Streptomyces sp. NPDC054871]